MRLSAQKCYLSRRSGNRPGGPSFSTATLQVQQVSHPRRHQSGFDYYCYVFLEKLIRKVPPLIIGCPAFAIIALVVVAQWPKGGEKSRNGVCKLGCLVMENKCIVFLLTNSKEQTFFKHGTILLRLNILSLDTIND